MHTEFTIIIGGFSLQTRFGFLIKNKKKIELLSWVKFLMEFLDKSYIDIKYFF